MNSPLLLFYLTSHTSSASVLRPNAGVCKPRADLRFGVGSDRSGNRPVIKSVLARGLDTGPERRPLIRADSPEFA